MEIALHRLNEDGTISKEKLVINEYKVYRVGRKSHNDFRLKTKTVSKEQCIFHHNEVGLFLEALKSKKNVFVNNKECIEGRIVSLSNGDIIQIGERLVYKLLFKAPDAVEPESENLPVTSEPQNPASEFQNENLNSNSEAISFVNQLESIQGIPFSSVPRTRQNHSENMMCAIPVTTSPQNLHFAQHPEINYSPQVDDAMQISIDEQDDKSSLLPSLIDENSSSFVPPVERRNETFLSTDALSGVYSNQNLEELRIKVENPDIPPTNVTFFSNNPLSNSEMDQSLPETRIKIENPDIPPTNVNFFAKDPVTDPSTSSTNATQLPENLQLNQNLQEERIVIENSSIPPTQLANVPLSEGGLNQQNLEERTEMENSDTLPINRMFLSQVTLQELESYRNLLLEEVIKTENPDIPPTNTNFFARDPVTELSPVENIETENTNVFTLPNDNIVFENNFETPNLDEEMQIEIEEHEVKPFVKNPNLESNNSKSSTPFLRIRNDLLSNDTPQQTCDETCQFLPVRIKEEVRDPIVEAVNENQNLGITIKEERIDCPNEEICEVTNTEVRVKEERIDPSDEPFEVEFVKEVRKRKRGETSKNYADVRVKQECIEQLEDLSKNCERPIKKEKLDESFYDTVVEKVLRHFATLEKVKEEPVDNNRPSHSADLEVPDEKPDILRHVVENNTSAQWSNSGCSDCSTDSFDDSYFNESSTKDVKTTEKVPEKTNEKKSEIVDKRKSEQDSEKSDKDRDRDKKKSRSDDSKENRKEKDNRRDKKKSKTKSQDSKESESKSRKEVREPKKDERKSRKESLESEKKEKKEEEKKSGKDSDSRRRSKSKKDTKPRQDKVLPESTGSPKQKEQLAPEPVMTEIHVQQNGESNDWYDSVNNNPDPRIRSKERSYIGGRVLVDDECPERRESSFRKPVVKNVEKKKLDLQAYRNRKSKEQPKDSRENKSGYVPLTTFGQSRGRKPDGSKDSRTEGSFLNELRTQPQGLQPPRVQPPGIQPLGVQPPGIQPLGVPPPGIQPLGVPPPGIQPLGVPPPGIQPLGVPGVQPLGVPASGVPPPGVHPLGVPTPGIQPQGLPSDPRLTNRGFENSTPTFNPQLDPGFPNMNGGYFYPGMYQLPFNAAQPMDPRMFPYFSMPYWPYMNYPMPGQTEASNSIPYDPRLIANSESETQVQGSAESPVSIGGSSAEEVPVIDFQSTSASSKSAWEHKNKSKEAAMTVKNKTEELKNSVHKRGSKDNRERKDRKDWKDKMDRKYEKEKIDKNVGAQRKDVGRMGEGILKKVLKTEKMDCSSSDKVFVSDDFKDELLTNIFSWDPRLFENNLHSRGYTPIKSLENVKWCSLAYSNYESYFDTVFKILLLHISTQMQEAISFGNKDAVFDARHTVPKVSQKIKYKDVVLVPLYVKMKIPTLEDFAPPAVGDLLLISVIKEDEKCKIFGYIEKIDREEIDGPLKWVSCVLSVKESDFDVNKYEILNVRPVLNVKSCVERTRAFDYLKKSPLLPCVLFPNPEIDQLVSKSFLNEQNLVCQKSLDSQQLLAVAKVVNSHYKERPNICVVEGTAGTGKTNLIFNMIFQLFSSLSPAKRENFRVLVCAPTDSEIDEIVTRVSKELELHKLDKDVLKMVVLGPEEGRRERSKELSLQRFARHHVETDIHRYQESMALKPLKEQVLFIEEQMRSLQAKYNENKCVHVALQMSLLTMYYDIGKRGRMVKKMTSGEKSELLSIAEFTFLAGANIIFSSIQNLNDTAISGTFLRAGYKIPVCIVDDATQIQELETLKVLAFGIKTLVLLGDLCKQPLQDDLSLRLKKLGWGNSLFCRIVNNFQHMNNAGSNRTPIVNLNIQYRITKRIDNWLRESRIFGINTLNNVVSEKKNFPLLPLTIFNLQHTEDFVSDEAVFASTLISCIAHFGDLRRLERSVSVGIIISDAEAKDRLEQEIENKLVNVVPGKRKLLNIEVDTVDKFSNHEKDIVLVSCIRNKHLTSTAGMQRFYTAVTRAKSCLIIYGRFAKVGKYKGSCGWHSLVEYARNIIPVSVYVESEELRRDLIR